MKVKTSFSLTLTLGLLAMFILSCGSSSFSGDTKLDPYGEPKLDMDENDKAGVTWMWGCDGSYSQNQNRLNGEGRFIISNTADNSYIRFKGDSCLGSKISRDIVFVVDVSNSMNYTANGNPPSDPVSSSTCGRLKAVEKTVSSLISKKEDAHFAILTFSDRVVDSSSEFFASQRDLYQNLVSNSTFSQVSSILCNADGGTDYDIALKGAKTLFNAHARSHARHEIYFISDGEPWPAESTGESVARDLRNSGTVIGTVMLGSSNDDVLKNKIASSNSSGSKLHANASKVEYLSSALSSLVDADIVKAQIQYRSLSNNNWQTIDVSDKISGSSYDFVTPIMISKGLYPQGMELIYTYWDAEGNYISLRGEVSWE